MVSSAFGMRKSWEKPKTSISLAQRKELAKQKQVREFAQNEEILEPKSEDSEVSVQLEIERIEADLKNVGLENFLDFMWGKTRS